MRMRRGCSRKHVRAIKQQEPGGKERGDTYSICEVEGAASASGTSTIVHTAVNPPSRFHTCSFGPWYAKRPANVFYVIDDTVTVKCHSDSYYKDNGIMISSPSPTRYN